MVYQAFRAVENADRNTLSVTISFVCGSCCISTVVHQLMHFYLDCCSSINALCGIGVLKPL